MLPRLGSIGLDLPTIPSPPSTAKKRNPSRARTSDGTKSRGDGDKGREREKSSTPGMVRNSREWDIFFDFIFIGFSRA
jgi:hypothetical protein